MRPSPEARTARGVKPMQLIGGLPYLVRQADFDDAAGIGRVHVHVWRAAYDGILPDDFLSSLSDIRHSAAWADILDNESRAGATFIAEAEEDGIIGFADCGFERAVDDKKRGEVTAIYVLPPWQRRDVGTQLVEACAGHLALESAETLAIWVLELNREACEFYEALGGTRAESRQISFAGEELTERCYRWEDVKALAGLGDDD